MQHAHGMKQYSIFIITSQPKLHCRLNVQMIHTYSNNCNTSTTRQVISRIGLLHFIAMWLNASKQRSKSEGRAIETSVAKN